MENAADALKMAGSILMFVIALSVAITAFSQARATSDIILSYSDRESSYIDDNTNYYYVSSDDSKKRVVGVETIIPSIYRAKVENYKIVFKFKDEYYYIYQNSYGQNINKIDLENITIGTHEELISFLDGLLYGVKSSEKNDFYNKFNINSIHSTSLFNKIKQSKFEENLGVYYQEEIKNPDSEDESEELQSETDLTNNKTTRRVITYSEI